MERAGRRRKGPALLLAAIVLVALAACVIPFRQQSLWVDEVFSLAMATGHSLEHAAAVARPSQGDFVEPAGAVRGTALDRYLRLEPGTGGPGSVLRAVRMSDLNPPLYYLLLHAWLRMVGSGDAALRLLSALCSLACLPVLGWLAGTIAGHRAVPPTLALFALAPMAVHAGGEARMYALLMLEAALHAALTLALQRRLGDRRLLVLLWASSGAIGLLTHLFFAFVWLAMLLWLLFHWRPLPLRALVAGTALTAALVVPWYRLLPAITAAGRLTDGWLDGRPEGLRAALAPLGLVWSYFTTEAPRWSELTLRVVFIGLAVAAVVQLAKRDAGPARWLPLYWLAGACLGPVLVDRVQGTFVSLIARYAAAGLPAAVLLAGMGLARLPARLRLVICGVIAICWLPPLVDAAGRLDRQQPFRAVAGILEQHAAEGDLVIVQSIPSGILGLARYLDHPGPLATWVEQLGVRRVPEDLERLLAGRRRVFVVELHLVSAPPRPRQWLEGHGRPVTSWPVRRGLVSLFVPRRGDVFAAAPPCAAPEVVYLDHGTVLGNEGHLACREIVVGPAYSVAASGELTLWARHRIRVRNGFAVARGGRLRIGFDPGAGAPQGPSSPPAEREPAPGPTAGPP